MNSSHDPSDAKIPAPHGPEGSPLPPAPDTAAPTEDAGAQALAEALGSSFKIVKFLMVALVVGFVVSGIFTVNSNEVAVVLRFGRLAELGGEEILKPGFHWALPYPLHEIVRIPVGQSRTLVSTTGWYATTPELEAAHQTPPAMPSLRPGVDGYTLTGDGNIIHAQATLKYRLNPSAVLDYMFVFANPTNLLRQVLENALFYASARTTADAAIFRDKVAFRDLVEKRVTQLINEWRLGVVIETLDVQTSPPLDVVTAFNDVLNAQLAARTKISDAESYARGATNKAVGQASIIQNDSLSRSNQLVKNVMAEAQSFSSQLTNYLANPQLFEQRLLVETMQRVLINARDKFYVPSRADGGSRELRLQLSREPQTPVAKEPGKP